MLFEPLHPQIVHFPIALMTLLPIVLVGALVAIRRGAAVRSAWGVAAAFAVLLTVSSFAATYTGEQDAERVEEVVGDQPVEAHEEAGEWFRNLALVTTAIVLVGLASGTAGRTARLAAPVAAVVLVVAGVRAGHSGGVLVYEHGAASTYATPDPAAAEAGDADEAGDTDDGDNEDEDDDD